MEGSVRDLSQYRFSCAKENFFLVSYEMAKEQLEKAEKVIRILEPYLEEKWNKG